MLVMIDLENLESYRENNRIEAKRATGGFPHSMWETYSSFANTMGGIILLGVEEYKDTSLHAVDLKNRDKYIEEFWRTVNDKNKVSANILSETDVKKVEFGGKRILAITVPRAERCDRPVYIGGDVYLGTYRRGGEGDYRCSKKQVDLMLKDAEHLTADMRLLNRFKLSALNFPDIKKYRNMLGEGAGAAYENLSDIGFLKRIGAVKEGADKRLHPTAAALLTFGKREDILRICKHFSLSYVDKTNGMEDYDGAENLFSFYCFAIKKLPLPDGENVREAAKEALINAIANADYRQGGGIFVVRGKESVSFINPGSFRTNPDRAQKGGVSDPRNIGIKKFFSRLGIGSGLGSGISSIYSAMRKNGWAEPGFKESFSPDSVTFTLYFTPNGNGTESKSKAVLCALIVQYLTEARQATLGEMGRELSAEKEQLLSALQSLISKSVVQQHGKVYKLAR